MGLVLLEPFPHRIEDPLLVGELAGLQLGVEQIAVHRELETTASRWNELQILDLLFVGGEELGRQTDGLRLVVSHRTVLEFHVHGFILSGVPLVPYNSKVAARRIKPTPCGQVPLPRYW